MIIELIIALAVGVLIGTLTGLTPGLHINLAVPLIFFLISPFNILPLALVVFIVSLSIAHTFIDFIPSIFLGAPNEDTSLSILPGHSLLLEGKGYQALVYCFCGCILGIFSLLILLPFFLFLMPQIYLYLKPVMFFILIFTIFYLTIREQKPFLSLLIFLLSGFLGLSLLNLEINSLLPLLSGLFGSSSILISLKQKTKIPKQEISPLKQISPSKHELKISFLSALLSSPLCSFLPALGSNQAAVISSDIVEEKNQKTFLLMLGSINVLAMSLSFITLYAIGKTRTGSAVFISNLLPKITFSSLMIILLAVILSGIFSFIIAISLSKFFANRISKINYRLISIIVLIFISLLILLFSGFLGFFIFTISTLIGIFAVLLNVRRTSLMGCLMLPTIIFYL